jgi:hypothetical protein
VIKARTWFTLLLLSFGTVAATVSCGSDEATGGGGGTGGGGLIGASGKAGGGSVSRAGSGSAGDTGTTGILGTVCAVDGDCATGFTCVTAGSGKFGGGGPSQGLCTASCTTDDDCAALEPGAGCVNMGTTDAPAPYCLEACTQGDPLDPTTKCQGRFDLACRDLSDPTTSTTADPFCVPRCRMDAECGTGLFCSPRTGLCSKTKPTGDAAGTPCDSNAATNNCAGICVGFPDSTGKVFTGYCADLCSGVTPCNFTGTTPGGLCLGALSQMFGELDEGFCEPTCTCGGECKFPNHICRGWLSTESALQMALNSPGLCIPPVMPPDGSVELAACEGGSGGAPETGGAPAGGAATAGAPAGGAATAGAPAGGAATSGSGGGGTGGA